jgi:hypothetical protein
MWGGAGGYAVTTVIRTGASENAFGGGGGGGGYNQNFPRGATGASLYYGNGGVAGAAGGYSGGAGWAGACVVRFPYEW